MHENLFQNKYVTALRLMMQQLRAMQISTSKCSGKKCVTGLISDCSPGCAQLTVQWYKPDQA